MSVHLLIVDALNLIRRIHAVQGASCAPACGHALHQLLMHSEPTHAVAVFDDDERHDSWRHQRLPGYKGGRSPMPDDLHALLPVIKQSFAQAGVPSWQLAGYEADDIAATLARKVAVAGHRVTLVSTDKGYCQLLSPSIQIRDYFQKRWLDLPFVTNTFGVQPQQLTDYWGLAGISGSKIPGVTGIGPKTAAQLIGQAGSLTALYQQLDQVGKWRARLEQQREMAFICQQVATLDTGIHLAGNLQQLRLPAAG
ncbi:flap endonuclease Xni [Acerihabitans arboris]|uniref:Flap endonuclease Xni n=1 Tax=Acerihabitans arboris TaxID=2691583 RepID=A0A845SKU3_9GAMM|nr:flap endonuclease Xni [Acerihabitans arboris]NDL65540.1 flap endonuclease Xni [Acerihabitans arboris]